MKHLACAIAMFCLLENATMFAADNAPPCINSNATMYSFANLPDRPTKAQGKIEVCQEYAGIFVARLTMTDLEPSKQYVLCINGSQNSKGNVELLKIGKAFKDEGYLDLPAFQTDSKGAFLGIVSSVQNLPPGEYQVKALLKEMPGYQVILQVYPGFEFTVTQPEVIKITKKPSGEEIEGRPQLVQGVITDKQYKYVYSIDSSPSHG